MGGMAIGAPQMQPPGKCGWGAKGIARGELHDADPNHHHRQEGGQGIQGGPERQFPALRVDKGCQSGAGCRASRVQQRRVRRQHTEWGRHEDMAILQDIRQACPDHAPHQTGKNQVVNQSRRRGMLRKRSLLSRPTSLPPPNQSRC